MAKTRARYSAAGLVRAKVREQSLVWVRWVGVAFAILQVSLDEPSVQPAGFALAAILAAGNLLVIGVNRYASSSLGQRALGLGALALDVAVLVAYTYVYAYEPGGTTWLVLYLAPLEAAWRFGTRGTLITAALVSVLYLPSEAYRVVALGYPFSLQSVLFRLGILWIVALFAGFMTRGLAQERDAARRLATERALMLEQLQTADRLKADFVSSVSHELRTPLTVLTGFIELMQVRFERLGPEQHRQYLDEMAKAGQRLTHRIEALLDFAALEGQAPSLERRPVQLDLVVHEAAKDYAEIAQQAGVSLQEDLAAGLMVCGDRTRLRTALSYLLDNAIKFNKPGGAVTIHSAAVNGQAVLDVRDNGIGMTASDLRRVFEPFMRAESGDRRVYTGQGLGLTLASRIVAAHGGRLEAESTQGVGSTFRMLLPIAAPEGAETGAAPV
jgi:signal transduction histidine kinase